MHTYYIYNILTDENKMKAFLFMLSFLKNRLLNHEEHKSRLNVSHLNHKSFDCKRDEYVTNVK